METNTNHNDTQVVELPFREDWDQNAEKLLEWLQKFFSTWVVE